jgi:tryptophan synthase alpha chain
VAASSTTGANQSFQAYQIDYFKRLQKLKLTNPKLIGFGISSPKSFSEACNFANGAIIGSAFIKVLEEHKNSPDAISRFIKEIKNN